MSHADFLWLRNTKNMTSKKLNLPNTLYYGDNLEVLRKYIKDETIDLCYIDPPFNSKRNYNQIYLNQGKEDKAQAHAFTDTWVWDEVAINGFTEILSNEKNRFSNQTVLLIEGFSKVLGNDSLLAYLIHITLRVTEIQRILKSTGSFYLHCDPTASHYLKLIIDTIFVANGGEFQNEIIWCYSVGGRSIGKRFGEKHDVIFWYSKSNEHFFNTEGILVPRNTGETSFGGRLIEENGIKYQIKVTKRKDGTTKEYKYPLSQGKVPEDWWIDINTIQSQSKERLGYPTQKPEALMERIIKTSTKAGDVVLDAYCGCGTTVSVAEKLQRKWIGIDITYQSISLILKRLEDSYGKKCLTKIELNGVPQDWESAKLLAEKEDDKTRKEFEKWAILFYSNNRARINEKKGGDGGIDGIGLIQERDEKTDIINKKIIFSVKSDKVLTPAYVNQLKGKMHESDVVMGILLCLYEPTKGMIKEAREMGTYKNNLFNIEYPKMQIISVKEMFDSGIRLNIPLIDIVKSATRKEDKKDQGSLDL